MLEKLETAFHWAMIAGSAAMVVSFVFWFMG